MRPNIILTYVPISLVCLVYSYVSKQIFDNVYQASKQIIDEEFHIPQGLAYCNWNFEVWNPKITTLPGLYLISTLLLAPFELCLIYWLRFVNLIASIINLNLIYYLFKMYDRKLNTWKCLLSSINVAILPPLYFFSHVYYTDMWSITFILLMLVFEKSGNHFMTSIAGMCAITMRQTNVIWVLMIFGKYLLISTVQNILRKSGTNKQNLSIQELRALKRGWSLHNFRLIVWLNFGIYFAVLISFGVFVLLNGSLVVGDQEAHTVSLHLPQIFYFSLFSFVFMWPYLLPFIPSFMKFIIRRKITTAFILLGFLTVIYWNTLVHPYILADNRHYTFYIWNRIYGRYQSARYVMALAYLFFLYSLGKVLFATRDVSFPIVFISCTSFVLVLQKMVEVRYFLIPYIMIRLNIKDPSYKQLVMELAFSLLINYLTFNVFFTKNIYWVNYNHAQKIIW